MQNSHSREKTNVVSSKKSANEYREYVGEASLAMYRDLSTDSIKPLFKDAYINDPRTTRRNHSQYLNENQAAKAALDNSVNKPNNNNNTVIN